MTDEQVHTMLADWALKGAELGACGKMCSDCAFKAGQPMDSSLREATEDAHFQLAWQGRFNCHTADRKDAGRPCAGFAYARQYLISQGQYYVESEENRTFDNVIF